MPYINIQMKSEKDSHYILEDKFKDMNYQKNFKFMLVSLLYSPIVLQLLQCLWQQSNAHHSELELRNMKKKIKQILPIMY